MTDSFDEPTEEELEEAATRAVTAGSQAEFVKAGTIEIIHGLRESCKQTFAISPIDDVEGHRILRVYLQVLDDFEQRMTATIGTGRAMEIGLKELRSKMN